MHPGPFGNAKEFHDCFVETLQWWKNKGVDAAHSDDLSGLYDGRRVVFTHADLCWKNIIVSPRHHVKSGAENRGNWYMAAVRRIYRLCCGEKQSEDVPVPRHVVAVVDWHQSGWYPIDWEWMKAHWQCNALPGGGGRDTTWLEKFIDPPDKAYAYSWEYMTQNCI